jgi:hypothetical protein
MTQRLCTGICIIIPVSDKIKSSRHEAFHSYAPAAKYDSKFNKRLDVRLAGQVWSESPAERTRRLGRARIQERSKVNPVWFEATNPTRPDEDFRTREFITYRHDLNN